MARKRQFVDACPEKALPPDLWKRILALGEPAVLARVCKLFACIVAGLSCTAAHIRGSTRDVEAALRAMRIRSGLRGVYFARAGQPLAECAAGLGALGSLAPRMRMLQLELGAAHEPLCTSVLYQGFNMRSVLRCPEMLGVRGIDVFTELCVRGEVDARRVSCFMALGPRSVRSSGVSAHDFMPGLSQLYTHNANDVFDLRTTIAALCVHPRSEAMRAALCMYKRACKMLVIATVGHEPCAYSARDSSACIAALSTARAGGILVDTDVMIEVPLFASACEAETWMRSARAHMLAFERLYALVRVGHQSLASHAEGLAVLARGLVRFRCVYFSADCGGFLRIYTNIVPGDCGTWDACHSALVRALTSAPLHEIL